MIDEQNLPKDLTRYRGTTPRPKDFDAFWTSRLAEADAVPLEWHICPADVTSGSSCRFFDFYFTGARGEAMYAKYVCPVVPDNKLVPLVLQFHGYPGSSRSWFELASFAGMGCAVLSMDCPNQGGRSRDFSGYAGSLSSGMLIAGLDGDAKDMYYVRVYQTIRVLCRIVKHLRGIDSARVYVNGGSQGGALGIVCAALAPELIQKASILYPFLSDFQKVWELGADEIAYEGLRYYTRWFDPLGTRIEEIFTKLGYVDVIHFAPYVRAKVLFGTGLADIVCPPCTQYAVYNNLSCSKRHVLFDGYGHEEIAPFDDLLPAFYAKEDTLCLQ